MALFAKKLVYLASRTSYVALLALAKKKGGKPISFIVYGYNINGKRYVMRSFSLLAAAEEGISHYSEVKEYDVTTPWLCHVAAGGGYEQFPKGVWVRVPTPRKTGWRRNKTPVQFADLGALYRLAKQEHEMLKNEFSLISGEISCMEHNLKEGFKEDENILCELRLSKETLKAEIESARMRILNRRCEMEFVRSKSTGIPLSDKSWYKSVMHAPV